MRISDWSSDVCSSDLPRVHPVGDEQAAIGARLLRNVVIDAARAAGDRPAAIEVHRAAQLDIDGARDPALDLVGGARLVDVDLLQQLGRDVGEIERRSEEHTSELQSLMRSSYAVFCL